MAGGSTRDARSLRGRARAPSAPGLPRSRRFVLLVAVVVVLEALVLLATIANWVYEQPPPLVGACTSACLPAAGVPPATSVLVFSGAQVAPLLVASLYPLVALVDARGLVRRLGALAAAAVGLVTAVHLLAPPASVQTAAGTYFVAALSPAGLAASAELLLGVAVIVAVLLERDLRRSVRRPRPRRARGRGVG